MSGLHGFLLCGGGTGGHVLPGLAVAQALRDQGITDLRWIGDPERIEAKLVPGAGIPLLDLGLTRPRKSSPLWWWSLLVAGWRIHREFRVRPPRAVIALGGYAAFLPGVVAWLHRRPLVVMEQNAKAGKTNRLLARFAKAVIIQFPAAATLLPKDKVRMLGNPVRAIPAKPRGDQSELTVLVVGGSLAAKTLNDLLADAAPDLGKIPHLRIVHLAGDADRERMAGIYQANGVTAEVHGFYSDMPGLYARIDLAVARAGATTVAELCAAGIGALYIPLPWAADDHQTANAQAVADARGAEVLPQAVTTGKILACRLAALAADRAQVAALGVGAHSLARPRAAHDVADLVMAL